MKDYYIGRLNQNVKDLLGNLKVLQSHPESIASVLQRIKFLSDEIQKDICDLEKMSKA